MGAHVWGPAYLRDHLLPQGQFAGWTGDWYAGFPAYQFYMVLPSLMIVLLNSGLHGTAAFVPAVAGILALGAAATFWSQRRRRNVALAAAVVAFALVGLPYGVAFKLVTVLGVVSLPICAYVFGRLAGTAVPHAGGVLGGDAAVPLLPGLHHLRREHPVDAGGRVRLLDLAQLRPALPGGRVQGAGHRPLPRPGRGAARPHRAVPHHPGVLGPRRHRRDRGGPVPARGLVRDPGPPARGRRSVVWRGGAAARRAVVAARPGRAAARRGAGLRRAVAPVRERALAQPDPRGRRVAVDVVGRPLLPPRRLPQRHGVGEAALRRPRDVAVRRVAPAPDAVRDP